MYSPKIDEELIGELYTLGQRLKKPMTAVVNEMIKESIPFFKIRANEFQVVQYPTPADTNAITLKRVCEKHPNVYVCPICKINFEVRTSCSIEIKFKKDKTLTLLVCRKCYEEETHTNDS